MKAKENIDNIQTGCENQESKEISHRLNDGRLKLSRGVYLGGKGSGEGENARPKAGGEEEKKSWP